MNEKEFVIIAEHNSNDIWAIKRSAITALCKVENGVYKVMTEDQRAFYTRESDMLDEWWKELMKK
jgi:hypothetical protein